MCDCGRELNEQLKDTCVDVLVTDDKLCIEYTGCACGSFDLEIKINYCPVCGEKL